VISHFWPIEARIRQAYFFSAVRLGGIRGLEVEVGLRLQNQAETRPAPKRNEDQRGKCVPSVGKVNRLMRSKETIVDWMSSYLLDFLPITCGLYLKPLLLRSQNGLCCGAARSRLVRRANRIWVSSGSLLLALIPSQTDPSVPITITTTTTTPRHATPSSLYYPRACERQAVVVAS
jgi:hypothetical protein